jgi:hypothetical protein
MKKLLILSAFAATLFGCQSEMSLSKFVALNENQPGFKSFTLSSNALKTREQETDEELKRTLDKITTIQLLLYNSEDRPAGELETLTKQALGILRGNEYESMMEIIKEGQAFHVSAKKSGEKFREIVIFGSEGDAFFLGRILGEIKAEDGVKLMQSIDFSQITMGMGSKDF